MDTGVGAQVQPYAQRTPGCRVIGEQKRLSDESAWLVTMPSAWPRWQSQIIAATSGPPSFFTARMPVGEVTLISVELAVDHVDADEDQAALAQMPARAARRSRARARVRSVFLGEPPRTMLERRSSAAGTRLTAPANSPSTRMMRLSPCFTAGRNFCTTHCFAEGDREQIVQRAEIEVVLA